MRSRWGTDTCRMYKQKKKFVTTGMKVGNTHFSCRFQINYTGRFKIMRHFWDGRTNEQTDKDTFRCGFPT